ncbi:MAG TPA: aminofutalosine synthase MqnE, partial [Sphingobacteriaceae bacterium]|nr:aminofutalosine synthase MqnE [Sphingobacteriaceae bacterium]
MDTGHTLEILLNNADLPVELKSIAKKVQSGQRISFDEGVLLYQKGELGYLGT